MIDNIIAKYLQTRKRLVVPDFGAFIRKDSGEIVFVEFLKKDDQILSRMIRHEYALDEHEAREAIEGYILNVRQTVGRTGQYVVEGIGRLHTDPNGLYALTYDPSAHAEAEPVGALQPEPEYHAPDPESAPQQEMFVVSTVEETIEIEEEPEPEEESGPEVIEFRFREETVVAAPPKEEVAPQAEEKKAFTLNDLYSIPAKEEPAPTRSETHYERRPQQPRQHPERPGMGSPRGGDGRPEAAVNADRPMQPPRADAPARPAQAPRQRPVNYRKGGSKSKADIVMIVAIVAALIAIGSMVYGIVAKNDPVVNMRSTQPQIENTDTQEILEDQA